MLKSFSVSLSIVIRRENVMHNRSFRDDVVFILSESPYIRVETETMALLGNRRDVQATQLQRFVAI